MISPETTTIGIYACPVRLPSHSCAINLSLLCDYPLTPVARDVVDPASLFQAPVEKMEASPKTHIVKHLAAEAKTSSRLILWLDNDREGENICFEVIQCCKMDGKMDRVHRAKFSSITMLDIRRAMDNLTVPDENQSLAVDCRQEIDLKIGCAFTRFQTRFFQGKYGNLDSSCISFGVRCLSRSL